MIKSEWTVRAAVDATPDGGVFHGFDNARDRDLASVTAGLKL